MGLYGGVERKVVQEEGEGRGEGVCGGGEEGVG